MANLSLTRVNQKLSQAKQLLSGVDEAASSQVHRNSVLEASAFHLSCAYQHYIREIAETYGLNVSGVSNEWGLIQAFEAVKKHPVEAEELSALRGDANSWLSQLQTYYDSLWQIPVVVAPQMTNNLINVVNIDKILAPVTIELMQQWHSEFVGLVLRHRETSAEF